MFNSEKLGVGKPEDCSWQSAGFRRPASQVGWYEPVDFFLPLFLLPLPPTPPKYTLESQAGWAAHKAVSGFHKQNRRSVTPARLEKGRCGQGHGRSQLRKVGKAPQAAQDETPVTCPCSPMLVNPIPGQCIGVTDRQTPAFPQPHRRQPHGLCWKPRVPPTPSKSWGKG